MIVAILMKLLNKIPIKVWIFGLIALTIITTIGLGYRHYMGLLDEVSTLRGNNVKYDLAVQLQGETIGVLEGIAGEWKQSMDTLIGDFAALQESAEEAKSETRRLNVLFAEHNFTKLAKAKPGLIERRVNTGSDNISQLFECKSSKGGCNPGDDGRAAPGVRTSSPSP